jgi:hypothetical protein
LQVLYEANQSSKPIESAEADRERMTRYADRYRRMNGGSRALVDAWMAAVRR